MAPDCFVRRARAADAAAISRLNNTFANEGQMLRRSSRPRTSLHADCKSSKRCFDGP